MAKEKGEKTKLYLLAIVGIVAVVGIVVLILGSGKGTTVSREETLAGQAISTSPTSSSFYKPDLYVEEFTPSIRGDKLFVEYVLGNKGDKKVSDVGINTLVTIDFYQDITALETSDILDLVLVKELKKEATVSGNTLEFDIPTILSKELSSGKRNGFWIGYSVKADTESYVSESDENNNELSGYMVVTR